MRILQVCAAYKPAFVYGGPTMSVSMLSENLVKAGIDTCVYATTANGINELPVIAGKPVIVDGVTVIYFTRITKDHTHFSPALVRALWREARDLDAVHIHAWWNLVSVLACLASVIRRVPVLLSPRGTLSNYSFKNRNIGPKQIIHQLIGKRLLKQCHVHVTSEREKQTISELFKPKSISLLPNFVKLPEQNLYGDRQPSNVIRLIFLSRIEEKKGLDILINALAKVTAPYHLTVAGDGDITYIASLKALATEHNIQSNIDWVGFSGDDKFDLLARQDLFILPSHDENFGNAVIESLSVGTPVLISRQVGLAAYVTKNKLGWLCETEVSSITYAINNIALSGQLELSRIRNEAPDVIYNDFNTASLVKNYINMYKQLVNND